MLSLPNAHWVAILGSVARAAGAVTILVGGAVLAEQPHMSADRDRHNNLAAEIERN
jgi:hypothetical protein